MMHDDFEQMCLIYIESQIINYRWHQAQIEHYRDMADKLRQQYAEELAYPRTGGGIIRMPEKQYISNMNKLTKEMEARGLSCARLGRLCGFSAKSKISKVISRKEDDGKGYILEEVRH